MSETVTECACCKADITRPAQAWEDQETRCANCGIRTIFPGAHGQEAARRRIRENTSRMLGIPMPAAEYERRAIHPLDPRGGKR